MNVVDKSWRGDTLKLAHIRHMLLCRLDLIKWKRRPFELFLCCSLNLLLTPIHEKQGISEIVWYSIVICYK